MEKTFGSNRVVLFGKSPDPELVHVLPAVLYEAKSVLSGDDTFACKLADHIVFTAQQRPFPM